MPMHNVNGTELFVETIGSGPALVLMHGGLGLDHGAFRPYFDQLADEATIIYYDHRGNGRSQRLDDYANELTFDQMVADLVGLLDILGLEKATLLGHSYGGFIAQSVAVAHADRLTGLVLVDTVPAFDYQPAPTGTDEQLAAFGELFSGPVADDATWARLWSTVWPLYFNRYDPQVAARIHGDTHYVGDAWNTAAGLLGAFNTLDELPGIDVPTLAVAGRHDFITPPEPGAVRLQQLMPNAELAVFDNSGHYPFIEEEATFFTRLRTFLADLD